MSVPDWTQSGAWDTLFLAGAPVPGTARVSISFAACLDSRKARGGKKSQHRDTGAGPAKLKIEIEMLPAEFQDFEARTIPILRPRSLTAPRDPVDISHPMARAWGVNVVIPGECDAAHPSPGGTMKVGFTLQEWVAAPTKIKDSATKPKDTESDDSGWNVQPLIDALRPARDGAAAANL